MIVSGSSIKVRQKTEMKVAPSADDITALPLKRPLAIWLKRATWRDMAMQSLACDTELPAARADAVSIPL
jgi:hypothetical protein